MNSILRFKYHYHVEIIEEGVLLFSEDKTQVLKGESYKKIAPYLIEAKYTSDEIASHAQDSIAFSDTYYLLMRLEAKGFIEKINFLWPDSQNAYCNQAGFDLNESIESISISKIFVKNFTHVDLQPLFDQLRHMQFTIVTSIDEANFSIVATDHYLRKDLEELQRIFSTKNIPWVIFKPVGSTIWLGPIFTNNSEKPCWQCLKDRLKINLLEETYVLRNKNDSGYFSVSNSHLLSTISLACSLLSTEIFKWIVSSKKSSSFHNQVKTFNTLNLELVTHYLYKRPQCSNCGHHNKLELLPLTLKSQDSIWSDGGDRAITPEQTVKKLEHLISPITGVLKSIAKSEDTPDGVHVYMGGFNFAQCNYYQGILKKNLRTSSSGKGESDMQAKASCLCEAIERHCGLFQGDEKLVKSTYDKLSPYAVHPKEILFFSDAQHANRDHLNEGDELHKIPEPFVEQNEIEWAPVWSMNKNDYIYLPAAFCYYNFPARPHFCYADSNGNSAGNTIEEALLQGLFELIERDAVAIWWYNRLNRPGVDLKSFEDSYLESITQKYHAIERDIWVIDITHDLEIPSFVAISTSLKQPSKILLGFGTHLNAKIAIKRAITEMAQSLPLASRFDKEPEAYSNVLKQWMAHATVDNQSYLKPLEGVLHKSQMDYPKIHHSDLLEDIHYCHGILQKEGMDLLVLNQSRPDIPLNVVKVIVPGLRHFWPQFAPGRLYDVPVKMGWLKSPLSETELNPIPMFL